MSESNQPDGPSEEEISAAARRVPRSVIGALVKAMRPRQWLKNVLVVVAPAAAGLAFYWHTLAAMAVAFVVFCMAASGIYLINDLRDVAADRAHPTKRYRPLAAGVLPRPVAYQAAAVLFVGSIALSFTATYQLAIVVAVYIAVQLGYCFGLKHQPVLDMCAISGGFLLRAVAGGAAANVGLSQWFLLVMTFGSLFMAAGKRYAERQLHEQTGAEIRKVLVGYTSSYLRFVWTMSATGMLIFYGLWAFDQDHARGGQWFAISMVPFFIAVLRYAVDVDRGLAHTPEDIAIRDRILQILGACWILLVGAAEYLIPNL